MGATRGELTPGTHPYSRIVDALSLQPTIDYTVNLAYPMSNKDWPCCMLHTSKHDSMTPMLLVIWYYYTYSIIGAYYS